MDYLQYLARLGLESAIDGGFKPCYKWTTFNTQILKLSYTCDEGRIGFKPCYKWTTFNTVIKDKFYWISQKSMF